MDLFGHTKRYSKDVLLLTAKRQVYARETRQSADHTKLPPMAVHRLRLSPQAGALAGSRDDEKKLAWIIQYIADSVISYAMANRWRVKLDGRRAEVLAYIALHKFLNGDEISQEKASNLLNVSRSAYAENWHSKKVEVQRWIAIWCDEINYC